jgi:FAD:protein FMN transferase
MIRSEALMGTVVTIHVDAPREAVDRAFEWFRQVEACCSRFDPGSELRRLGAGTPHTASPMLFEAVRFALQVAEETDGAFDPTVGARMAARGYDRHYRTGASGDSPCTDGGATYRDIELDAECRTILLKRPLTLDLGAVAKGLAVDAAARELATFRDFSIDAGGDLYFGGHNGDGEAWRAGIRHPRDLSSLIDRIRVSDQAVCTSGAYARGEHLLDPRIGEPARGVASATVVAPTAMLADALATAAFVLGPADGLALLERVGVEGLIVTPDLACHRTRGFGNA